MTPEAVKSFLIAIREPKKDFTIEFTGKTHRRINGRYFPDARHIEINDRNFTRESSLLHTAIHEYAHHLQFVESEKVGHNREFWTLFHDLMDAAIEKNLYQRPPRNNIIVELEGEIRDLSRKHAALEKQIGDKLRELHKECEEFGTRSEFEVERELKETPESLRKMTRNSYVEQCGESINSEQSAAVANYGAEAAIAILSGKTVIQAKSAGMKKEVLDPYDALKKELAATSAKIERLEGKRETLTEKIKQYELDFEGARA